MAAIGVPMYICATHRHPLQRGYCFRVFRPERFGLYVGGSCYEYSHRRFGKTRAGPSRLIRLFRQCGGCGFCLRLSPTLAANLGGVRGAPELAMAMTHSWLGYSAAALLALLMLRSMLSSWSRPATAV